MLGKKINPWMRRLVTRFINTIPTTIAILLGLNPLIILVYSQVALSLLLPLPLAPLWWFTRNRSLMGVFTNRRSTTVLAGIFVLLIIGLTVMLLAFTFAVASYHIVQRLIEQTTLPPEQAPTSNSRLNLHQDTQQ